MKQELIPISRPHHWKEAIADVPHAFGHTWENCNAMFINTGLPTYLYSFISGPIKVLCPITERRYNDMVDIVTPYGFSGFVGNVDYPEFQYYWKRFASELGYVSGYIGLNPVFENKSYLAENELFTYNTIYVLDLQLSIQTLFQRLSHGRKSQLKGFDNDILNFTTEKTILKDFFLNNYKLFFTEKNAGEAYHFSSQTISYLLDLDQIFLVGRIEKGEVRAVSVFAFTSYIGEYLFNVSKPGAQSQSTALLWFGIQYLKSINIPFLNLGGGINKDDSLAQFKQRFGALPLPLKCLKQIYNLTSYNQLCQKAGVEPDLKSGYFPAYWKPK